MSLVPETNVVPEVKTILGTESCEITKTENTETCLFIKSEQPDEYVSYEEYISEHDENPISLLLNGEIMYAQNNYSGKEELDASREPEYLYIEGLPLTPELMNSVELEEFGDGILFADICNMVSQDVHLNGTGRIEYDNFYNLQLGYTMTVVYQCKACLNEFQSKVKYKLHDCDETNQLCKGKRCKTYKCFRCDKVFKSRVVFMLHLDQHKFVKTCPYCKETFEDEFNFDSHMKIEHNSENPSEYLSEEEMDHNEEIQEQCDVCGKITSELKKHKIFHTIQELEVWKIKRKTEKKMWFYCKFCDKKVYSEIGYLFHIAEHKGEKAVQCPKCEFVSTDMAEYNVHIGQHNGTRSYVCNDCNKCFYTRSAISDHVLLHMDETRYMCELCGKQFKTCRAHAQHKLLQHKKYRRCTKCNRGFSDINKLKSHLLTCENVSKAEKQKMNNTESNSRYFCEICNTFIKSTSEIAVIFHRARHEGKEGVPCVYCDTLCRNVYMYRNHQLIHNQERPYNCQQCTKAFRTKGCLVQHMLVHGDEYRYTCDYCGKKSKKLTTHINHVNIHTDTRPYSCPDCNRPFRQLSDMKKHRKTHERKPTVDLETFSFLSFKTEVKEEVVASENVLF